MLQERQTGADNARARLNRTPEQRRPRTPGGIVRFGADGDIDHSDDTGNADEETQTEDEHEAYLPRAVEVQSCQQRHGHQVDPDVASCVVGGPGPAKGRILDTFLRDVLVPACSDGGALEDGGDDEAERSADDDGGCYVAERAEFLGGEEPEVEGDEGQFVEADGDFVEDLEEPEILGDGC